MYKSRILDFIVLIGLALISIPMVLFFHVRFLTSSFIFFGLPSLYLIARKTQNLRIIFSGAFFIGIFMYLTADFLATLNQAWFIPQDQLFIPYRLLGAAPIDELVCAMLWTLLILLFYEHFFEKRKKEYLNLKHFTFHGIIPGSLVCLIIFLFLFFKPSLLLFRYSYFVIGGLTGIPFFYSLIYKPSLVKRVIKVMPYFIFLFLIFEFTALYLKQWYFPGEYIGYVEIFKFKFPIEELIVWITASSVGVLSDYKLFVDDQI